MGMSRTKVVKGIPSKTTPEVIWTVNGKYLGAGKLYHYLTYHPSLYAVGEKAKVRATGFIEVESITQGWHEQAKIWLDDDSREIYNNCLPGSPKTKSDDQLRKEIFGKKFRVNEETSELLQETVNKLDGKWKDCPPDFAGYFNQPFIFITSLGEMTYSDNDDDFERKIRPEADIEEILGLKPKNPLTGKDVKVSIGGQVINGFDEANGPDSQTVSLVQPGFIRSIQITGEFVSEPQTIKLNLKEENIMTRRTVKVELFDDDKGLPVDNSLVKNFGEFVSEDTNDVIINEVLMAKDVAAALKAHNVKRADMCDEEILNRTGNTVNLRPVKLKDLRWNVTG